MAEYLIQGETLANMADKIRVLNGVEGAMTPAQMNGNLGEVSAEVDEQAELIAQIASALEGKAAGGGGESPEQTALILEQTELISEQDAKITQLAEILSSNVAGGNVSVKTATVDIDVTNNSKCTYVGKSGIEIVENVATTIDVVVPSICYIVNSGYFNNLSYSDNVTVLFTNMESAILQIEEDAAIFASSLVAGGGGGSAN